MSSRAPGAKRRLEADILRPPTPAPEGRAGWVPRDARTGGAGARLAPCAATEVCERVAVVGISSVGGSAGRTDDGRRARGGAASRGPSGEKRISKSASRGHPGREKNKMRGARDARGRTAPLATIAPTPCVFIVSRLDRVARASSPSFLEAQTRSEPPSRALPFARRAAALRSPGLSRLAPSAASRGRRAAVTARSAPSYEQTV